MKNELISSIPEDSSAKFVSGLDALYYFVKLNYDDYTLFYNNYLLKYYLDSVDSLQLCNNQIIGSQWYRFEYSIDIDSEGLCPNMKKLCKIGFKNLNRNDNNESIEIQMYTSTMNHIGYKKSVQLVNDFLITLGLEPLATKISRVDLNTYVLGHNFENITYFDFSTKAKVSNPISKAGVLETFYLGKSTTDSVQLKIYNKNKELHVLANSNHDESNFKYFLIKMRFLMKYSKSIDIRDNLWNIEFKVRRGTLRRYKIDSVEDLFNNVDSIHKDIVNNTFRMLETKKKNKNNQRVENHHIWKSIESEFKIFHEPIPIDKEKLKLYKKDRIWFKNRMIDFIEESRNENDPMLEDIKSLLSKYS